MEIDFGGPHNAADFSRSTPTRTPLLDFRTVPYSADPDGYCERKVWGITCPSPGPDRASSIGSNPEAFDDRANGHRQAAVVVAVDPSGVGKRKYWVRKDVAAADRARLEPIVADRHSPQQARPAGATYPVDRR